MQRIKWFKDIEGLSNFSDYAIDTDGNVWSYKYNTPRILKPGWAYRRGSYLYVCVVDNQGKRQNLYIHRLVARAFIPTDNHKIKEVTHLNGNLSDNRIENLDWIKKGENRKKKKKNTDTGYELDITITKRIKDIHTASVRKGLTIPSSYDFMKEIIEKGIQEHVRQYGLQKILYQMNQ